MIGLLSGVVVAIEESMLVVMIPSHANAKKSMSVNQDTSSTDHPRAMSESSTGEGRLDDNARAPNIAQNFFGVGYRVEVTRSMCGQARVGHPITIHTRLSIKSDSTIELIGFSDEPTAKLYEKLITVQGVGRSLALALIEHMGYTGTLQAITHKDVESLKKVKGLGAKIATRLVNELSQHRVILTLSSSGPSVDHSYTTGMISVIDDVIGALNALGFDESSAHTVAAQHHDLHEDQSTASHQQRVDKLLKKCLQTLGRGSTV